MRIRQRCQANFREISILDVWQGSEHTSVIGVTQDLPCSFSEKK